MLQDVDPFLLARRPQILTSLAWFLIVALARSILCPDRVLAPSVHPPRFPDSLSRPPYGWPGLRRHLGHNSQVTGCQFLLGTDGLKWGGEHWPPAEAWLDLPFRIMLGPHRCGNRVTKGKCSDHAISDSFVHCEFLLY